MTPLQLSSLPLQISAGGTVWAMMPTMAALAALGSARETVMAALVPPAAAMRVLAVISAAQTPLSVTTYVLMPDCRNSAQACATGWNGLKAAPPVQLVRLKVVS